MNDNSDIPPNSPADVDALAAELSLGLLVGDERKAAERRARIDPVFAAMVADWDIRLAAMCERVAPVTPPKGLFKRITNDAYPDSPKGIWRQLGVVPALICAGLAAVVLGLTLQFGQLFQPAAATPTHTVRMASADNSVVVAAVFVSARDTLFVEWQVGARLPDRDVEMWMIAGEDAPVSLGVLATGTGITEFTLPDALQSALSGAVFAVSVEPLGGSPTGAPTGAILAIGPLISL